MTHDKNTQPDSARGVSVWTVHATLAAEVRPTEAVFSTWPAALDHAKTVSRDSGVLAASVVRFTLDELGTRTGVATFVHGRRQQVPYVSDCRALYANGRKI
jgi:putative Ca2+/H+ antiporter (TMEM165/GDT1 family)